MTKPNIIERCIDSGVILHSTNYDALLIIFNVLPFAGVVVVTLEVVVVTSVAVVIPTVVWSGESEVVIESGNVKCAERTVKTNMVWN